MIYLFYGPDGFNRRQAIRKLIQTIPADVQDFNLTVIEGRQATTEALKTACAAYPMLHDRRLVVAHNLLKQQRTNQNRDALREIIKKNPDTTDIVFNEDDAPDQRVAYMKDLQQLAKAGKAQIVAYEPLEGAELQGWINAQVQTQGTRISPAAVQRLIEYLGADSWALYHEIDKLATYVGFNGTIEPTHIELLSTDQTETNLFTFIDALCSRKGTIATQLLHELLADGAAPLYILTMIARQVRLMLYAHHAGTLSQKDLAQVMGQRPFVARKAAEQSRLFQAGELQAMHRELISIDHAIKTGTMDAHAALETMVATYGYN